jgi:CubicO group peptidase (beta-lactamase class C family)
MPQNVGLPAHPNPPRAESRRLIQRFPKFASALLALVSTAVLLTGCVALNTQPPLPVAQLSMTQKSFHAQTANAALDRELRDIVEAPNQPLTSLAVAVILDGRTVYENAFGDAIIDLKHSGQSRAATPDTLYRIASISKLVVSLGVLKLLDDALIDLDRDVSDYLGYSFRNPNFPDTKITLRMLMTHTSSLRDSGGYNFPESIDLRDVVLPGRPQFGKGEMWARDRAPGGYFHYCNFAWGVIATVMERVSNERFDRLMQRILFVPLGITATFDPAQLSPQDQARVATLYRKRTEVNGKEVWNSNGPWIAQVDDFSAAPPKPRGTDAYRIGTNGSLYGPQGGLRISVRDLARVMQMLLNEGVLDGRRVLSKNAVRQFLDEQWRFDRAAFGGQGNRAIDDEGEGGLFNAWALGPQHFLDVSGKGRGDRLVEGGGFTGFGHLGNAYGLTSAFVFDPKTRNGLIFLVGGIGSDPEKAKGRYSAFYRYEERILTALYAAFLK